MSDNYNANIYLSKDDLNDIEDRIDDLTEECKENIFGKDDSTYGGKDFQIETTVADTGDVTQMLGDITQHTTTGKNIYDINGIYSTSGSSFIRTWEDGIATLTWSAGFALYLSSNNQTTFTFNPNETYTFSFEHKGNALHLRTDEGNTNRFSTNTDTEYTRYSYTFTGISSLVLKFVRKDSTGTAYLKNFQIEKGTTATTYEEYTGGIASPNPNYPQPINVVSGRQVVNVLGKNLFNGEVVQGFYIANGGISISNTQIRNTEYIKVEPNTTYTFSNTNNLVIDRVCYYDSSKTFIERSAYLNSGTITTLNNNCKYIRITIRASDGSNITPSSLVNPQLEKGKNLFDYTTSTFSTPANVNITTENNTITMTTTTSVKSNDLFFRTKIPDEYLINGQTYTISSENVSGVAQSLKLQLRNKNGSYVSGKSQLDSVVYDNTYSLFIVGNIYSTNSQEIIQQGTTAIIKNVQVEKGNEATSYESYGNSNYESYRSSSYEINLGKNLFNINTSGDNLGIDYNFTGSQVYLDGSVSGEGSIYNDENSAIYVNSGTYTFSIDTTGTFMPYGRDIAVHLRKKSDDNAVATFYLSDSYVRTQTFTLSNDDNLYLDLQTSGSGSILLEYTIYFQLEKGNQTTYTPYKTPIYLGNIGNYLDFIRKGTGKNLFDKNNANTLIAYINGSGKISQDVYPTLIYIPCKPNTKYALQKSLQPTQTSNRFKVGCCSSIPEIGTQLSKYTILPNGTTETTMIFETDSTANYLVFNFAGGSETEVLNEINTIQIEEGNEATLYEPYDYKDKWYIHKEIGRVVLDGSESWSYSSGNLVFYTDVIRNNITFNTQFYCNYFKRITPYTTSYANMNSGEIKLDGVNSGRLILKYTDYTSANDFKTWLSTHNTEVYYVLNVPTNTEITDIELIEQLEEFELFTGINNISVISEDLNGTISIYKHFSNALRNIEVGDDLGGKTLYLSFPRTIHMNIPDDDTNRYYFINTDTGNNICRRFDGKYKAIGISIAPNMRYLYSFNTQGATDNPYLNFVRFKLPKNFGVVTTANKNSPFYEYVKILDESIIPDYKKHIWSINEPLTMQKIDNIEQGIRNIGYYYNKPNGWVQEKEWLPTATTTYVGNRGVGVKTISYQDLNRWYNNLDLINFDDLNEMTLWNAINDISQIEWNGESDEEWVDNFVMSIRELVTEDDNTLMTEDNNGIETTITERI